MPIPQFDSRAAFLAAMCTHAIHADIHSLSGSALRTRIATAQAKHRAVSDQDSADAIARADAMRDARVIRDTGHDKRVAADYVRKLATELASRYVGQAMHTRISSAIADLAKLANIATIANIPHKHDIAGQSTARANAAIAITRFADSPSTATWLQADRALSALSLTFDRIADRCIKSRLLDPSIQAPEPTTPPVKRGDIDSLLALHAGSSQTAKVKPGSCPPTFSSAADHAERCAVTASRLLAIHCQRHASLLAASKLKHKIDAINTIRDAADPVVSAPASAFKLALLVARFSH